MVGSIGQNFGGGGVAQGVPVAVPQRSESVPLPLPGSQRNATPTPAPAPVTEQNAQDLQARRMEAFRQSVNEALPRFYYPVSDVRFTIYKDSAGQYVTSVTNIISGERSQIPEPVILSAATGGGESLLETFA